MLTSILPETGAGNTRLECQLSRQVLDTAQLSPSSPQFQLHAHVDWFDGVSPVSSFGQVVALTDFICGFLGDVPNWYKGKLQSKGLKYFNEMCSAWGVRIYYTLPEDVSSEFGYLRVSISGVILSQLTVRDQWRLLSGLRHAYRIRSTRFDACLDVFGYPQILQLCSQARASGNYSGMQKSRIISGISNDSGSVVDCGTSLYFGSPESDKRLRIYDKSKESGGSVDSIRFECQFRSVYAHQAFKEFTDVPFDFDDPSDELHQKYLMGIVCGSVDFINRKSGDRLSRQDRLSWWADFVDLVGACMKISVSVQRKFILEKTINWLERQVCPSLALVRDSMGVTSFNLWFKNLLADGKKRLSPHQKSVSRVAKGFLVV